MTSHPRQAELDAQARPLPADAEQIPVHAQLQSVPRAHRSVFAVLAAGADTENGTAELLDVITVGLPHPAGDDSPSAASHCAAEYAMDTYRRPVEVLFLDSFRSTMLLQDAEREVMRRIWQATVTQGRPFTVTDDDRALGFSARLRQLGLVHHTPSTDTSPGTLALTVIGETLLDQIGCAAPVICGSALSGTRVY